LYLLRVEVISVKFLTAHAPVYISIQPYPVTKHSYPLYLLRVEVISARAQSRCEHTRVDFEMCQPHKLWRFPDFSQIRDQADTIGATQLANSASKMLQCLVKDKEYESLKDVVGRYHNHSVSDGQCWSVEVQRIRATVEDVWSVVRSFDKPQTYKHFIRSCSMGGDGTVGSTREVRVVSGLPAERSTERLEILDDDRHVLSFRIVGGDHRLKNYQSFTTVHQVCHVDGKGGALVIESYVVDVPEGNSPSDTCLFVDTIVKCNLQSLARTCEHLPMRCRNPILTS